MGMARAAKNRSLLERGVPCSTLDVTMMTTYVVSLGFGCLPARGGFNQ